MLCWLIFSVWRCEKILEGMNVPGVLRGFSCPAVLGL